MLNFNALRLMKCCTRAAGVSEDELLTSVEDVDAFFLE